MTESAGASVRVSAATMADRFGLPAEIVGSFGQLFDRWDGKGTPSKLKGEQIALPVRVLHIADIVEVFDRIGGPDSAVEVTRLRRGGMFDPNLADCFVEHHEAILPGADGQTWETVIDADPALGQPIDDGDLDDALATLGDYADLKCPSKAGHSRGVADLAAEAMDRMGMPAELVRLARQSGFVYDLGVIGV